MRLYKRWSRFEDKIQCKYHKQVKKAYKVQRIIEQKEGLNPQDIQPRAKRTAAKNARAINKILAENFVQT